MSSYDQSRANAVEQSALRPWQVLHSRNVFLAKPWLKLSVHQVRLPSGKLVDDYHQIELQEYTVIFAQAADGRVVMERQYRHGVGRVTLVLPRADGRGHPVPAGRAPRPPPGRRPGGR